MKTKINKQLILNRFKNVKNFKTDTELASYLGIKNSTLSNWYARNTLDFDLLFSKCENSDLHWLITGEIFTHSKETIPSEVENPVGVTEANMLQLEVSLLRNNITNLENLLAAKDEIISLLKKT